MKGLQYPRLYINSADSRGINEKYKLQLFLLVIVTISGTISVITRNYGEKKTNKY